MRIRSASSNCRHRKRTEPLKFRAPTPRRLDRGTFKDEVAMDGWEFVWIVIGIALVLFVWELLGPRE